IRCAIIEKVSSRRFGGVWFSGGRGSPIGQDWVDAATITYPCNNHRGPLPLYLSFRAAYAFSPYSEGGLFRCAVGVQKTFDFAPLGCGRAVSLLIHVLSVL